MLPFKYELLLLALECSLWYLVGRPQMLLPPWLPRVLMEMCCLLWVVRLPLSVSQLLLSLLLLR
jgi:hypothetical protein